MKILRLSVISFAVLSFVNNCFSQLVVDAGNDTAFCNYNWEQASLGGNPTAGGGTPPYTYTWSTEYKYGGHIYTASFMLEDTTVANPVFISPFSDSATFYLTVTDSDQTVAIDSVTIRFSQYTVCTGDCFHLISIGDSVQLGHCISGGIPPFHYSWTPEESLSDPNSETPWAKPLSNTRYELIYTDSVGCRVLWSCEVSVAQSGIQTEDSDGDYLQVYPIPTNSSLTFIFDKSEFEISVLKIFNVEGRLIKEISVSDTILEINVDDMLKGVYFYTLIKANKQAIYGKIMIE